MDFSPERDSWSADEVGRRGARRRPRNRRPPQEHTRRPGRATSFARAFWATVGVLILLVTVLVVVVHGRGPALSSMQVDVAAVTTTSDQQLRLFANQSVSHIAVSQVRVTPRAPFTVQTAGTAVIVQFAGRLRSATTYAVTISGVTSVFGSAPATFSLGFTTSHASVLLIERQPGGQDSIVRASVGTPGLAILYRAARIQAFGAVGSDLVVVTDDRRTSTIALVAHDGTTEDLLLPGTGLVHAFALDAVTGIVSFTWAPSDAPSAEPRPYTIDLQGQHTSTLATGAAARRVLQAVAAHGSGTTSAGSARVAESGRAITLSASAGSRPVALTTALAGHTFSRLSVSPNGQYVSVVTAASGASSDDYTIAPAPRSSTTVIVDVATGATIATFSGVALAW